MPSAIKWSNADAFVDECIRAQDAGAMEEALRGVPVEKWREVHERLAARLDQAVPGEPSPPLTKGEERGAEVLGQAELAWQARVLDEKRRALAEEVRRRER